LKGGKKPTKEGRRKKRPPEKPRRSLTTGPLKKRQKGGERQFCNVGEKRGHGQGGEKDLSTKDRFIIVFTPCQHHQKPRDEVERFRRKGGNRSEALQKFYKLLLKTWSCPRWGTMGTSGQKGVQVWGEKRGGNRIPGERQRGKQIRKRDITPGPGCKGPNKKTQKEKRLGLHRHRLQGKGTKKRPRQGR